MDSEKHYLSDIIQEAEKEGLMYVLNNIIKKVEVEYAKKYGKIKGADYKKFVKDVDTAYQEHKKEYS